MLYKEIQIVSNGTFEIVCEFSMMAAGTTSTFFILAHCENLMTF